MSSFYIYDQGRERVGILQNEDSVQWLENFQSPGEVKIEARVTEDNLAFLVIGNRIYNTDSDASARICHVDIVESGIDGQFEETIIARAQMTSQLLDDRVVMATENITNVEAGMYRIYTKNRRELPIETAMPVGYTETLDTEITWNSVLDAFITLSESSGLGFKVIFDPETASETLTVYKGVDRSTDAGGNYVGYFSSSVGNMYQIEITSGITDFKNVAVVAGEGEGANRAVQIVSLGNVTGENRREMYVDARDLQRESQNATFTGEYDSKGNPIYNYTTVTYTAAQYATLLEARGLQKLAERLRQFDIVCEIDQSNMRFGEDYFLGDRMPVRLTDYGLTASAVVSSATRIYESGTGDKIRIELAQFEIEE